MIVFIFSLVDRVRRTVRGSADDIGWLQRDPTMPPVEDGTERFIEILGDIRCDMLYFVVHIISAFHVNGNNNGYVIPFDRHGVHRLPNSMVCLLLPGIILLYHTKIINNT